MPGKEPDNPWIRRLHPEADSKVHLVCLPHAGGTAEYFGAFAEALRPSIHVLAIQYPGRRDRVFESMIVDIEDAADRVAEQLCEVADRPIVLFGHGMGAALAFEITRRLEEEHEIDPVALFASGSGAPSRLRSRGVHLMDDTGLLAELSGLRARDATPWERPEASIVPLARADYRAIETYACRGRMTVRSAIFALSGDRDPSTTISEALVWREHTEGEFQVKIFPGGHFFMEERLADVVNTVTDYLLPICSGEAADPGRPTSLRALE